MPHELDDVTVRALMRAASRIVREQESASTEALALAGIELAREVVAALTEQPVRVVTRDGWYMASSVTKASER